ncbi:extracellular solute-binding protein [Paenibacillus sp. HWE-109]|uniref:ABC transporter substrate-binding protein n=1 Tax=Paenibacillus sp. HWE-109 TaxID=1306526 RepID=UPI001EDFFAF7|nr:extracellular solute-binding protein [Paenibacillus sp. HWE-109]UKS27950.1 extracellular solute-binding protein [Paenibacillus sp. HWE-109]
MKKSMPVLLASLFALATLASGCGGQKEAAAPGATVTPKIEASVKPADPPKKVTELKVSGFKSGSELGAIPEINDKFMKENPDIKVTYEGMPGGQFSDYIKTRLAAGDASDVIMLHPGSEVVKYAKAGYLKDLSSEPWIQTFTKSTIVEASADSKVYGIPNDMVLLGVYYNKAIFEKLTIQPPKNWEEFLAACEKIKASGVNPIAIGNNDGWMTLAALLEMSATMVYGKEADFDAKLNAGQVKFAGVWDETVRNWYSLADKGYVTPKSTGVSLEQAQQDFAQEKSAMYIDGSWSVGGIKSKNPNLKFGMFAMPANKKGEPLTVSASTGTTWVVNAKTANADAAKRYMAYWAKEETLTAWTKSQGAFLTLQGKKGDVDPVFDLIADTLAAGKSQRFPDWDQSSAINNEMMKSAQGVYLKALTPEQMLKNMDDALDKAAKNQK